MPGWIWWILAFFMILMVVIGAVYVLRHAMAAMRVISRVGAEAGKRTEAMSLHTNAKVEVEPPLFTQPLRKASREYADAHAEVIERKEARQNRYARTWAQWSQFNK